MVRRKCPNDIPLRCDKGYLTVLVCKNGLSTLEPQFVRRNKQRKSPLKSTISKGFFELTLFVAVDIIQLLLGVMD